MSITLSETFSTGINSVNRIEVKIFDTGVFVDIVRDATAFDSAQVLVPWGTMEDVDAVAELFLYEPLIMFKTLVPMLIKAKTLRAML